MLGRTLDLLLEETEAERGFIVTLDEQSGLSVRSARNLDGNAVTGPDFRPSRTVIRKAVQEGTPVRFSNAQAELGEKTSIAQAGLQSILAVPIRAAGEVVAIVCVDSTRPDAFDAAIEARVQSLSEPLGAVLFNATRLRSLQRQGRALARRLGEGSGPAILGESPALREVLETARRAAATSATILIQGETGTGKELVAREIHRQSPRSAGPFRAINCGALVDELMEAELFGHAQGAFTGATQSREGHFAAAHGGTLFLDEVGELAPAAQARFLRALETGEIQRLGDDRSQRVDVRIVAATHRNLLDPAVSFRQDLYYRLAGVTLRLPPLRERREDLDLLAETFSLEAAIEVGRRVEGLSSGARSLLHQHDWPGNVRELRNAIHRATIFSRGPLIEAKDLPLELRQPASPVTTEGDRPPPPLPGTWEEVQEYRRQVGLDVERSYVARLLEETRGNVSEACRKAGLSRQSFYELLERVELNAADFRRRDRG